MRPRYLLLLLVILVLPLASGTHVGDSSLSMNADDVLLQQGQRRYLAPDLDGGATGDTDPWTLQAAVHRPWMGNTVVTLVHADGTRQDMTHANTRDGVDIYSITFPNTTIDRVWTFRIVAEAQGQVVTLPSTGVYRFEQDATAPSVVSATYNGVQNATLASDHPTVLRVEVADASTVTSVLTTITGTTRQFNVPLAHDGDSWVHRWDDGTHWPRDHYTTAIHAIDEWGHTSQIATDAVLRLGSSAPPPTNPETSFRVMDTLHSWQPRHLDGAVLVDTAGPVTFHVATEAPIPDEEVDWQVLLATSPDATPIPYPLQASTDQRAYTATVTSQDLPATDGTIVVWYRSYSSWFGSTVYPEAGDWSFVADAHAPTVQSVSINGRQTVHVAPDTPVEFSVQLHDAAPVREAAVHVLAPSGQALASFPLTRNGDVFRAGVPALDLPHGAYGVQVTATDELGHVMAPVSFVDRVHVDRQPPAATGFTTNGGARALLTAGDVLNFRSTLSDPDTASVRLFVHDASDNPVTTWSLENTGGGVWQRSVSSLHLDDGGYWIILETMDAAGNRQSVDLPGPSFIVDSTAPTMVPLEVRYPPGQSGVRAQDAFALRVRVHDVNDVASVETMINGRETPLTRVPGTDTYEGILTAWSTTGDVSFPIISIDTAGNQQSVTVPVRFDNEPPRIEDVQSRFGSGGVAAQPGDVLHLQVLATDLTSAVSSVYIDASSISSAMGLTPLSRHPDSGVWRAQVPIDVQQGHYNVTIVATDGARNEITAIHAVQVLPRGAHLVDFRIDGQEYLVAGDAGHHDLTAVLQDPSGIQGVEVQLQGGRLALTRSASAFVGSWQAQSIHGVHDAVVHVTFLDGLVSSIPVGAVYELDLVPPAIHSLSVVDGSTGAPFRGVLQPGDRIQAMVQATDGHLAGITFTLIEPSGARVIQSGSPVATNFTLTEAGAYTIEVTVADAFGRQAQQVTQLEVEGDSSSDGPAAPTGFQLHDTTLTWTNDDAVGYAVHPNEPGPLTVDVTTPSLSLSRPLPDAVYVATLSRDGLWSSWAAVTLSELVDAGPTSVIDSTGRVSASLPAGACVVVVAPVEGDCLAPGLHLPAETSVYQVRYADGSRGPTVALTPETRSPVPAWLPGSDVVSLPAPDNAAVVIRSGASVLDAVWGNGTWSAVVPADATNVTVEIVHSDGSRDTHTLARPLKPDTVAVPEAGSTSMPWLVPVVVFLALATLGLVAWIAWKARRPFVPDEGGDDEGPGPTLDEPSGSRVRVSLAARVLGGVEPQPKTREAPVEPRGDDRVPDVLEPEVPLAASPRSRPVPRATPAKAVSRPGPNGAEPIGDAGTLPLKFD